ncbi:hypothetical protein GZ77_06860 [Endozoicomonas montiporae]|uniref:Uncharacterized protein n=2 Tax=Endozoicomonas montiporae TaxID=1027273 RepID=A0A081N6T8_9GAMM|nr:hypothetical protein GZ77_06860 [Endozoicomonas montiporae]
MIACHRTCKSTDTFTDTGSPGSLSQQNDKVRVRLFHWHLASGSSYKSASAQLEHIQSDLTSHLRSNKLNPNILVFTGTEFFELKSKNQKQWQSFCKAITNELGDPEQLLPLNERCQNSAFLGEKTGVSTPYTFSHYIHMDEIAVISLLPIRFLRPVPNEYRACNMRSPDDNLDLNDDLNLNFYHSMLLTVRFDDVGLKMMIAASPDQGVDPLNLKVGRNNWDICMEEGIKPSLERHISYTEPMIAVSHISSNSFNPEMMTRVVRGSSTKWAGEKELDKSVNSEARYYAKLGDARSKSPRISQVMYRKGYSDNKKGSLRRSAQRFYAFHKNSSSYLDYLYYMLSYFYSVAAVYDYAPMYPSYTTFTIDSTLLEKLPESPENAPEFSQPP